MDFEVFKVLNQADIYEILKDFSLGIKKKVYQSYEVWQKNYLTEDDHTESRAKPQTDCASGTSQSIQQSSKEGVSYKF